MMVILLQAPADANTIQAWVSIAQLLITIGTAAAIISTIRLQADTLKLQADTFAEQQKITLIEQKRFKIDIRPDIDLKLINQILTLTPIKNDLLNLKIRFSQVSPGFKAEQSIYYDESEDGIPLILQ